MTFGAHKLVHSEPFLDHRCENWHLLSALCSDVRKKIYIGAHSTVSALNYCSRIFWKPLAIYTKWCAQTFPPIFGLFSIFDHNLAKIVSPPSDECENYVAYLKVQSLPKKRWKPRRNRPINGNAMRVRTMHPSNARRSGLSVTNKKTNKQTKKQTPHFRTYSRRALYDLPQTLHGDRARRAHQKKWDPFFDPTYTFSYRVHGKFWPNLPTRGFSAIAP